LLKKHPNAYRMIRRTIQQVAPFFDDFQLNPDPLNEEAIRLAWTAHPFLKVFTVLRLREKRW